MHVNIQGSGAPNIFAMYNSVCYLAATKNDKIILNIEKNEILKFFASSDLCRTWHNPTAPRRCQYSEVMYGLHYYAHGLTNYMGLETADANIVEYNWFQVYGAITVITGLHTNYFIITRIQEKRCKTLSNSPKFFENLRITLVRWNFHVCQTITA